MEVDLYGENPDFTAGRAFQNELSISKHRKDAERIAALTGALRRIANIRAELPPVAFGPFVLPGELSMDSDDDDHVLLLMAVHIAKEVLGATP